MAVVEKNTRSKGWAASRRPPALRRNRATGLQAPYPEPTREPDRDGARADHRHVVRDRLQEERVLRRLDLVGFDRQHRRVPPESRRYGSAWRARCISAAFDGTNRGETIRTRFTVRTENSSRYAAGGHGMEAAEELFSMCGRMRLSRGARPLAPEEGRPHDARRRGTADARRPSSTARIRKESAASVGACVAKEILKSAR